MADEFSKLAFEDDLKEALQTEDASRWTVKHVGELELRVTAYPITAPTEKFQVRFLWSAYPSEPPSYKFLDLETGRADMPAAWPTIQGYRPGNLDACVNWTVEGFNTHPEWRNDANIRWNPKGNAIIRVLRYMQKDLDERFMGRHKP